MKKIMFIFCALSLVLAANIAVIADNPDGLNISDPAFDKYVDTELMGIAVDAADPALMTDLALQLIEGERVLLRSHRAISAENMLKAAAKAAAVKGDKESEARIKKVAEATGKTALVAELDAVAQMAVTSRSGQQTPKFTTDGNQELDKELASIVVSINDAVLFQNKGLLDEMEKTVKADKSLPEKVAAELGAFIAKSKSTLPEKVDPASAALVKLAGASRQSGNWDESDQSGGEWDVESGGIVDTLICDTNLGFYSWRMRARFIPAQNGNARVVHISSASPLQGRLMGGDVITDLDGIPVKSSKQLNKHYRNTRIDFIRGHDKPYQSYRATNVWLGW